MGASRGSSHPIPADMRRQDMRHRPYSLRPRAGRLPPRFRRDKLFSTSDKPREMERQAAHPFLKCAPSLAKVRRLSALHRGVVQGPVRACGSWPRRELLSQNRPNRLPSASSSQGTLVCPGGVRPRSSVRPAFGHTRERRALLHFMTPHDSALDEQDKWILVL